MEKLKLQPIGNGAYANVYSFKEDLTGKKFALKKLKREIKDKEIERFKQEFKKMKEISNPNILKAYSYNEEENSYIMDFCDYSLKDFILNNNTKEFMDFNYRKNIALQFLNGLKYLHSKEILHRDLSYNNVLIQEFDDNIVMVKISDFGLIKNLDLDLTSIDSSIRGTIIDDTLISFKDYNIKNEIYEIGVVLWFIFTGRSNLNIDDSNIGKIIKKCINRNHSERYNNVDEIIIELNILNDDKKNKENFNDFNSIEVEKLKNRNGLDIDDFAFTILKAMIEDKAQNQLYYLKDLAGEHMQTSDGEFSLNLAEFSPRNKAKWKSALEKLINNTLIIPLSYKNEIFEVTSKGYEFYDMQKDDFVVQVIN